MVCEDPWPFSSVSSFVLLACTLPLCPHSVLGMCQSKQWKDSFASQFVAAPTCLWERLVPHFLLKGVAGVAKRFYRVLWPASCHQPSISKASNGLQEMQPFTSPPKSPATNQRPTGNNNSHSRSVLVLPQSGVCVSRFPVVLKNWYQNFAAPRARAVPFIFNSGFRSTGLHRSQHLLPIFWDSFSPCGMMDTWGQTCARYAFVSCRPAPQGWIRNVILIRMAVCAPPPISSYRPLL